MNEFDWRKGRLFFVKSRVTAQYRTYAWNNDDLGIETEEYEAILVRDETDMDKLGLSEREKRAAIRDYFTPDLPKPKPKDFINLINLDDEEAGEDAACCEAFKETCE